MANQSVAIDELRKELRELEDELASRGVIRQRGGFMGKPSATFYPPQMETGETLLGYACYRPILDMETLDRIVHLILEHLNLRYKPEAKVPPKLEYYYPDTEEGDTNA